MEGIVLPVTNRKVITITLSLNNESKLNALSAKKGVPKARILDEAVDTLYREEEVRMGNEPTPSRKCPVITIATNKGGCGKTTSAAAIADVLAKRGNQVLVIDADPQGNLSKRFGYIPTGTSPNYIGKLLLDRMDLLENNEHHEIGYYINDCDSFPRIKIITSDLRLDKVYAILNAQLVASTGVFRKFIKEIKALNQFDYIIIDTRPSLNNEVGSVMVATDYVMIPVEPTEDAILGADATITFMASIRSMNDSLKVLGIFMTKVYNRNKSYHEAAPLVKESWKDYVFKTEIPRSQDADNAGNEGKPVTTDKFANKKLAKRYEQLVEEAVNRIA